VLTAATLLSKNEVLCTNRLHYVAVSFAVSYYHPQSDVVVVSVVIYCILISIHTIQCRTRRTVAEQYIQEEYIKYSKNTTLKTC